MKKMLTLFAVILAIGLGAPHAEAKKFGGGKSFGKSYKTAPAQPAAKPVDNKNPTLGAQAAPKKSGMMGGLLGSIAGWGVNVAIALTALRTNLMRSILTTLGVMIGVFSVILAVAA